MIGDALEVAIGCVLHWSKDAQSGIAHARLVHSLGYCAVAYLLSWCVAV